jgi:hypothetical protein
MQLFLPPFEYGDAARLAGILELSAGTALRLSPQVCKTKKKKKGYLPMRG